MQMEKNAASPARQRLASLFDDGVYQELGAYVKEKDAPAGAVTGYGYVNGNPVCAFAQDQSAVSGAVGMAQAEKIGKLYALAAKVGAPVVGIYDSNGAFVDGTAVSLNAYSSMLSAAASVSGVVPQIALVAGVCSGSAAVMACTADLVIMTEDAELYLTPGAEKNAGSAEVCAANGTAALTVSDTDAALAQVRALINLLPVNNLAGVPCMEYAPPEAGGSGLTACVQRIADGGSVTALYAAYADAAYTALATVNGATVGIAATNKTDAGLTAADCEKLARFVRLCDAFSIPVITLVDTPGFAGNTETELAGAVRAMTRLAGSYAEATTAKISVVTGTAVGAAFTVLAGKGSNTDISYAYETACIAPLAPEAAVEFLWHDKLQGCKDLEAKRRELAKEYAATLASAGSAAQTGVVDEIVTPETLRETLCSALAMLEGKRVTNLPRKHSNLPF